jgi:hypothetical protein
MDDEWPRRRRAAEQRDELASRISAAQRGVLVV